uniref:Uncharacterized protein n=1 Tax=Romanomermis culicivorax TaxID=13658 RepID=A0A915K7W4_ROMCU
MTETIAGDFDEIFKNRYTEKDEAYLKVIETNKDNRPLCIYPWSSKPKRTFDYASTVLLTGKEKFWKKVREES